jgi:hypothetical protein
MNLQARTSLTVPFIVALWEVEWAVGIDKHAVMALVNSEEDRCGCHLLLDSGDLSL